MPRLPISPEELRVGQLTLDGDRLHYLRSVLRLRIGDQLEVFDGQGRCARATLTHQDRHQATLDISTPGAAPDVEAGVRLNLLFGVTKGEVSDRVVRATTELGVHTLSPVVTARAVAKPSASRRERWQRIAEQAARQSGRAHIPQVQQLQTLSEALAALPETTTLRVAAWEEEKAQRLRDLPVHASHQEVAALIGPEGGLTEAELRIAEGQGFVPITLGPRVLRAGTAALVTATLLLHRLDELG